MRNWSPRQQSAAESFAAELEGLREDRDHAIAEKDRAYKMARDAQATIEGLHNQLADTQSRMTIHQLERDQAVAELAELKGRINEFCAGVRAGLDRFAGPITIPQILATDAEAPVLEIPSPPEFIERLKK